MAAPHTDPKEPTMQRRHFLNLAAISAGAAASGSTFAAPPGEMDVADYDRQRRYTAVGANRIAYVELGSGPGALFLHGFPLNSYQWRGVLPRLASLRRCIAPDFLGLGHSQVA